MAITNGREEATAGDSQLREVTAWVRPETQFPVPRSDGYSIYSALLSVLSDVDEDVGQSVHDSSLGSLHCSGLLGEFGGSDRPHHKSLLPGETYELSLGIVHPNDAEVFQALVNALVLQGDMIELSHGQLHVERFESENTTHGELLDRANTCDDPMIEIEFRTPTCIEEAGSVTTMFPTRMAVFGSLLGKWDNTAPEELALNVGRETLVESVIEKPNARSYDTHSVLVNRVNDPDGGTQPIFRQGFSGTCAYAFKDATESVVNAVTALALFAEYSGIGSAVARGCGDVSVKIIDS
jgi:CRISPR-associated endoribonuclease Cas6